MEKIKYIPFLKTKSNELLALKELETSLKENLTVFFDIPKKQNGDENTFINSVKSFKRKLEIHLSKIPYFYIDTYDIDNDLFIDGTHNYSFLLNELKGFNYIPVVSIDRVQEHIDAITDEYENGNLKFNFIALRLTSDLFENFLLIEDDINKFLGDLLNKFDSIDLILDCRVCYKENENHLSTKIINFISDFSKKYLLRKVIISGSSIPSSINEIVVPNSKEIVIRKEFLIFAKIKKELENNYNLIFSDYTIVSPEFSEVDIPPEMFRKITAPKIIYSFNEKHFILRGGSLSTKGDAQYFKLAEDIVLSPYYRGKTYSWGDDFLFEKSKKKGSNVTPSSILKPTINAHIQYMITILN